MALAARVRSGPMREQIVSIMGSVCLGALAGAAAIYASTLVGEERSGMFLVVTYAIASGVVTAGCLAAFLRKGG